MGSRSRLGEELLLGGVHARFRRGEFETCFCYFYRGKSLGRLRYFTTGPDYMKNVRSVRLADGRIALFSRFRNEEIKKQYGCESPVGFTLDFADRSVVAECARNRHPEVGDIVSLDQITFLHENSSPAEGNSCTSVVPSLYQNFPATILSGVSS